MTADRRPIVCSHRGRGGAHPDNSLAAFRAAIELGAEMLETDVRRAPDGRLILHHDRLVGPPADGMCTLPELIALADGRVMLDVELKEPRCEEDVLRALTPRPPGLVVTSFRPDVVSVVSVLAPDVATGLLLDEGDPGDDPVGRARACGARLLAPHVTLFDESLRAVAAEAGLGLIVWTVNGADRLAELMSDPAVDCIITDDIPLALAARDGH